MPQALRICTARAETALRELRRTFHVKHDRIAGDLFVDEGLNVH